MSNYIMSWRTADMGESLRGHLLVHSHVMTNTLSFFLFSYLLGIKSVEASVFPTNPQISTKWFPMTNWCQPFSSLSSVSDVGQMICFSDTGLDEAKEHGMLNSPCWRSTTLARFIKACVWGMAETDGRARQTGGRDRRAGMQVLSRDPHTQHQHLQHM